jgi:hypothetical protein
MAKTDKNKISPLTRLVLEDTLERGQRRGRLRGMRVADYRIPPKIRRTLRSFTP